MRLGWRRRPADAPESGPDESYKRTIIDEVLGREVGPDFGHDLELRFLDRLLTRGSVFVDVGANAGEYSVIAEHAAGSRSVVLVEPLPALAERLRERFPFSHVVAAAVSVEPGEATIKVPSIEGRTYLTRATLNDHMEQGQTGAEEVTVGVTTLDDVVADSGVGIVDVLKIDVEGHELEALSGAHRTLSGADAPIVLIEIETRHHEYPITTVFAKLEAHGLQGFFFDPRDMTLRPVAEFETTRDQDLQHLLSRDFIRYLNNFWFVPPARVDAFAERARSFLAELAPLGPTSTRES